VTRYLSLAEFWHLAERVTGINAQTLIKKQPCWPAESPGTIHYPTTTSARHGLALSRSSI